MITTDFVPGSPCWLDLGAPDVAAAAAFYGAVLGWEFQPMGADAGQFGLLKAEGRTAGGIGALTEEGARSAWMLYFHTPDAEASARAVERLGGTVRVPPADMGEWGTMAQLSDPQGAQFAVWQPPEGGGGGLEAVNRPNSLNWTELYTTDVTAAKQFYGTLFGWESSDMTLPGDPAGTYSLITPGGDGEDRMQGGMMQLPADALSATGGRPYWHPVFEVTDCDAAVTRVTGHGGSVQMPPETAEGVGRMAVCLDPHGADFVLLTPSPM